MRIWIVEKKTSKGWVPHENFTWLNTKREARRESSRDSELRTVAYERRGG